MYENDDDDDGPLSEDQEGFDVYCPVCDGWAAVLGQLGHLRHYRCRACGKEFSRDTSLPGTVAHWPASFHLRIDLRNDAFGGRGDADALYHELVRILRDLMENRLTLLDAHRGTDTEPLFDINGNTVGRAGFQS